MPTTPVNVIDYRSIRSLDTSREAWVQVALAPSTYYPMGCALGVQTVGSTLVLAVTPAAGTGTPVAVMPLPATTDASGNITFGTPATTAAQYGYTESTVGVLAAGTFNVKDLYTQSGAAGAWVANNFIPNNGQSWGGATLIGNLTSGIVVK